METCLLPANAEGVRRAAELLQAADRIYVLYGGRVAAELDAAHTSEAEIMHYAVGGKKPFRAVLAREGEDHL